MNEVQQDPQNQQPPINNLLNLEKLGATRFFIHGNPTVFHFIVSHEHSNEEKYITIFANGLRNDDFFVQVPVLQKKDNRMMFMNFAVEKDHLGWRILA